MAVLVLLAVAGCGPGSDATKHATATDSPSTTSATPTVISVLTGADAVACRTLIENDGPAYQLLADLQGQGHITGEVAGQLQIQTMAGTTSTFDGQIQNPDLAAALRSIETDAPTVEAAIQARQPVDGSLLLADLVNAATICQQHGTTISWYTGS